MQVQNACGQLGNGYAHDAKASCFNKFFNLFAVQWILLCNFATDIASAELPFGYANRAVSHGGPVWMRIVEQLKLTKMYEHIVLNEPHASMRALKKSPFFMTKTENAYDL